MIAGLVSLFLALGTVPPLAAQQVVNPDLAVPAGTTVLVELEEDVTSRRRETERGDVIEARVARDVVVDGDVVIEQGAELLLRVEHARKAKFLGRKGALQLSAFAAVAVDGTEVPLQGSYLTRGKGRKVVTGTLAVVVAWPFAFLKGRNARAEEGTVFEARVDRDTWVAPALAR